MISSLLRPLQSDAVQLVGVCDGLATGRHAVRLEQIRYQVDHVLLGQAAGIVRRHGADNSAVKRSHCFMFPLRPEAIASQRGSVLSREIAAMAGSAVRSIERLAVCGLR